MINKKNDTTINLVRRVTLVTDPTFLDYMNLNMVDSLDQKGYRYQVALDALPAGITLDMIKSGQEWFIERRTGYNRLFFPVTPMTAKTSAVPSYYGNFYDTTTQTATLANTVYPISLNTDAGSNGFSVVSGNQIVAQNEGTYNFVFSAQLYAAGIGGNSVANIAIWLQINGITYPWPGGIVSISAKNPYTVTGWNYLTSLNPGDVAQFVWESDTAGMQLQSSSSPIVGPQTPSMAVVVTQL